MMAYGATGASNRKPPGWAASYSLNFVILSLPAA